ncbi:hypothetical protein [Mesobacillus foraminis]|uniref:hypothetical protein n=1 Tax=Mesobacillus foraminis TaxID=279826 RepID=UPI0013CE4751|nr:hypothetical protein [Mesobacillus foraminis]
MGLLISVPGASLSAKLELSLLIAGSCGVSAVKLSAGVCAPSTPINRASKLNVELYQSLF